MIVKFRKIIIVLAPFILLLTAIIISIAPDFYRISITPPGKTFPLIHNHITDYYYYLSLIHQGYEGNWLLTSRMTPENFRPVFAQTFFALLGQLARVTNITGVDIYFLSRILCGAVLMLAVIYGVNKLFKDSKHKILGCLLVFFSTGFWTVSKTSGQFSVNQFLTFWTRLDPILRTTFLPHHLASTILGMVSLFFLAEALDKNDRNKALMAGLSAFLSGLIYFATMVNIAGGLAVVLFVFIIVLFIKRQMKRKSKMLLSFLCYFLLCGLSLLYLFYISRTTFPWSTYASAGERFTFGITLGDYIGVLGPTFILTLIGIPGVLREKKWLPKLLLGWTAFPFVGIILVSRIYWKFADVYYLEAASYIPLGILAIYGWKTLEDKIFAKVKWGEVVTIVVLLLYFTPPIISSYNKQLEAFSPYYYNLYIPNDVMTGLSWLDNNTPSESVVLAGGFFGSIIPAFSHNRVVYGHPEGTYRGGEKSADVNLFFSQKDSKEASNILLKYDVSYIFYALDTDPPQDKFIQSISLSRVFSNNTVKIFKVEK